MGTYKTIENYNEINLNNCNYNSDFKYLPSFIVEYSFNFGISQINDNFISTIIYNRPFNITIPESQIDNFLCVFFKNRIVLTEKIRNKNNFIKLINKNFWKKIQLVEFVEIGCIGFYFVFECVETNIVTMNNASTVLIPLFEKG